jgi:hypothetical protein
MNGSKTGTMSISEAIRNKFNQEEAKAGLTYQESMLKQLLSVVLQVSVRQVLLGLYVSN